MSTPAEDGPGTGSDPITPAEEEDDDVFEAEPTPPAEVEANANKRRSQSLSSLQPQTPLKVSLINCFFDLAILIKYNKTSQIILNNIDNKYKYI